MKVMCKIKAFYNGEIIKPGAIIEFKGNKLPSWAKEVKPSKKEQTTPNTKSEQPKQPDEQTGANGEQNPSTDEQNGQDGEQNIADGEQNTPDNEQTGDETAKEIKIDPQFAQELAGKTETELNAILDDLITKGLDKGILIDTENKTIIEQIYELTIKLSEEK